MLEKSTGDKKSGKRIAEVSSTSKIPSEHSELYKYFLERHSEFVSEKKEEKDTGGENNEHLPIRKMY